MQYIGILVTQEEWERWSSVDASLRCPELFSNRPRDVSSLWGYFWQKRILLIGNLWYAAAPVLLVNLLCERLAPEALLDLFRALEEKIGTRGCELTFVSDDGLEVEIARRLMGCSNRLDSLPDKNLVKNFWTESFRLIRRHIEMYPTCSVPVSLADGS